MSATASNEEPVHITEEPLHITDTVEAEDEVTPRPTASERELGDPMHVDRAVFHIGDHGTDGDAIRNAINGGHIRYDGSRVELATNWPDDSSLAFDLTGDPAHTQHVVSSFEQALNNSVSACRVVSGNAFEMIAPEALLPLAQLIDRRVIIAYAAPHKVRLLNQFLSHTSFGSHTGSLLEFLQSASSAPWFNLMYNARFTSWHDAFGADLVVRPVIPGMLTDGDVVADFVHHALGEAGSLSPSATRVPPMKFIDALIIKRVQAAITELPPAVRYWVGLKLARHLATPAHRSDLVLQTDVAVAEALNSAYREDATEFDETFWDGQSIFVSELDNMMESAISTPMSVRPEDYLDNARLRHIDALGQIILRMLQNNIEPWDWYLPQTLLGELRDLDPIS